MTCFKCKVNISSDEVALTKKLVNRGCTKFLCVGCLGDEFKVSKEALLEKIEYFKKAGCWLFGG